MSPMTVRWKPLIVMSGLFLVVGVLGLIAYAVIPSDPGNLAGQARAEWKTRKKYDRALIQYRRALQKDGRNPELHEQMAQMFAEWAEQAPAKRNELRAQRLHSLTEAAKYGKQRVAPRRMLLADALQHEDMAEAARWAKELVALEPKDADAHYVLAAEALAAQPAEVAEARRHLAALEPKEPGRPRTAWAKAALARETGDDATLAQVLDASRNLVPSDRDEPVDRMARIRLGLLDARRTTDPQALAARVKAARAEAERLAADPEPAPNRITQLGRLLDQFQGYLGGLPADPKGRVAALKDELEGVSEAIYRKAIDKAAAPDPRAYYAYAEHLLIREHRARCLDVVSQGLALKVMSHATWMGVAMSLREVGIKAALLDPKDPERYRKAEPLIKDLIAAPDLAYQGAGHLFQGVIDLERSGLADPPSPKAGSSEPRAPDAKLQASALTHLKAAATDLPRVATAQALYGVALMLSREPALGRQYLQNARRLGNLEPRYQVWAAWSMIQAGYPEEAEPIVAKLLDLAGQGQLRPMEPMLHMLQGEIYQARRTPDDLRKARAEYQKTVVAGQVASPALQLRMAQIDLQLGDRESGARRIAEVQAARGGPAAETLAVLVLRDQNKPEEARKLLAGARRRYPDSDELVGLEATMLVQQDKAEAADRLLADFLAKHPDHLDVRLARARLLASSPLNRPDDARALLNEVADGDNSAPLVQLTLLELQRRDVAAASRAIARIRARWKEAAAADLLDAQLALVQENPRAAAGYLDEALRKDPTNKVALFWKAQLDERAGASAEAAQILESIAKDNPTKEVAGGLSLAQAAQWALASMALENQDLDGAIARLQGLLKGDVSAGADRQLRWQLAVAQATKGQWAEAKAAVEALLKDPNTTAAERVQAANFFRMHDELAAANAQLDMVLRDQPGHPQAVASRALILANAGKPAEAVGAIRRGLAAGAQPPALYMMLAATENLAPPASTGLTRTLAALDLGLKAHPDSVELVRAKYLALKMAKDPGALAFVEQKAQGDTKGPLRRLLIDTYRDEGELAKAETVARELLKEAPRDSRLAATLLSLVAAQAARASDRGDRETEARQNAEAQTLIRRFRTLFPADPAFPMAECELAARHGDLDRALALTRELDKLDRNSPAGPLMRARIDQARGRMAQMVEDYAEALARNPRRVDVRLSLARTNLLLGQVDEALRQADLVLEAKPGQPAALIVKARALSSQDGTPAQVSSRRDQAVRLLREGLAKEPKLPDLYHEIAKVERSRGHRAEAIAALKDGLKAVPTDDTGLAILAQVLTEPREPGRAVEPKDMQEAMALAESFGSDEKDKAGVFALALALGFHQSGQHDLALPWAEKAAAKLDRPVVHLTFGDILLAKAEATSEPSTARATFTRAVAEYDRVLKVQASSVEAVNNKAWILHRYLNNNAEALALAESLSRRADPETLPAEFLDTLGAIQEAMNKPRDAEATYAKGLRKAPDFAMLNYHMGKLIAADRDRAPKAVPYLEKAQAGRGTLPPSIATEVDTLLKTVSR
jgi:predicted Zn-dependent protease